MTKHSRVYTYCVLLAGRKRPSAMLQTFTDIIDMSDKLLRKPEEPRPVLRPLLLQGQQRGQSSRSTYASGIRGIQNPPDVKSK